MSNLISQEAIGSLLPLLHRANAVVKELAEHRYTCEPHWIAEVKIELCHGLLRMEATTNPDAPIKNSAASGRSMDSQIFVITLTPQEAGNVPLMRFKEHYEVAAKIRSSSAGRWFTLNERS